MLYRTLVRPILFSCDAEWAHNLALGSARRLGQSRLLCQGVRQVFARPSEAPVTHLGLTFPHRLGLAGGMDKNGVAPLAWWAFGFGFVELGTVTPRPQGGNDRPRMFRKPAEHALVNRMGFNNAGAEALVEHLRKQRQAGLRPPYPVGVSVGKNKVTPADQAADDFAQAAAIVAPEADFLTINVSSPNTPGLRALQEAEELGKLVTAVMAVAAGKPVLIKIAPELAGADLAAALEAALGRGAVGVIATNTLGTTAPTGEPAGLSGRPLRDRSRAKVAEVRKLIGDGPTLIGCGGIDDVESAQAMLDAGADLLQLYTGLVYEGPFLPGRISRGIRSAGSSALRG